VAFPLLVAALLTSSSTESGNKIATVLAAHGIPAPIIAAEREQMCQWRTAATANRSVVGVMNEFSFLAAAWRDGEVDLLALALRLAGTPCGPLYPTHGSPDHALIAHVRAAPR
jgi:hypothetical protein